MAKVRRNSRRATKLLACLTLLLVPGLIYSVGCLRSVRNFTRTLKAHTISERDLSPSYQIALNATLHTIPCCPPVNWSPTKADRAKELIPRIIHQTWKTTDIPAGDWQAAHNLCLALYTPKDDWKHMFWTDESARAFIAREFPDFLPTYDRYPYAIERVDALRYFLLYHYGGVYMDLDVGCARAMESILKFPAFLPRTTPSGVSNDVIGVRKGHPFMKQLMEGLMRQGPSTWLGTKYITVFFTTGPMFVNQILAAYWSSFESMKGEDRDKVFLLPAQFYHETHASYFVHFPGSSWHGSDAKFVGGFVRYGWVALLFGAIIYLAHRWRLRRMERTKRLGHNVKEYGPCPNDFEMDDARSYSRGEV